MHYPLCRSKSYSLPFIHVLLIIHLLVNNDTLVLVRGGWRLVEVRDTGVSTHALSVVALRSSEMAEAIVSVFIIKYAIKKII